MNEQIDWDEQDDRDTRDELLAQPLNEETAFEALAQIFGTDKPLIVMTEGLYHRILECMTEYQRVSLALDAEPFIVPLTLSAGG